MAFVRHPLDGILVNRLFLGVGALVVVLLLLVNLHDDPRVHVLVMVLLVSLLDNVKVF